LNEKWWKEVVFYQIYPRSFADSNGDGIGDLNGIRKKLEYLKKLGIGAIWLSPHYPSPMVDCGYDVADYCAVAPEYGTLDEFKNLLVEAHALGIRVVLDLVLNHTSDQHPWFLESKSGKKSPKRNWYIWKKGKNGGSPNDWNSTFGGSAWELDPTSGDYYYHYFFKEQPDLNWDNAAVQEAMWEVIRF
jgi:alpha-glucosidase